ncbi:MAG: BLUF domain-containing protein [Rhizobiaceae bacterium]
MNQTDIDRSAPKTTIAGVTFRLIYRSKCLIPAASLDAELGNILRVARHKNAAQGITGALLLYDDWFAQTLEGEEGAVRSLYAHIERDPRHSSVQIQEEGLANSRVFSRWAMAMVGEHGNPDIPLAATSGGTTEAAARVTTPAQEKILDIMRDATRGYGRGS